MFFKDPVKKCDEEKELRETRVTENKTAFRRLMDSLDEVTSGGDQALHNLTKRATKRRIGDV